MRFMMLLLLLLGTVMIFAQKGEDAPLFTQMDWDEMRIDSLLPVYTEVIPLETDYRSHTYTVGVSYPEWGLLTRSETAVAERFADRITDHLVIETQVGVSRGVGMLDVSFVPIIRRDGKYLKLLSGKIEITAQHNGATRRARHADTPRWASQSVLASGRWAKISITDDGIYHLTTKMLSQMGFSNPSKVRLYGYGGHLQLETLDADTDFDDLEAVPLLPVKDGFLFAGNGLTTWRSGRHVSNHYATAATYFVTEADSATSFPTEDAAFQDGTELVTTCAAHLVHAPMNYSWYQGGRQFFENTDYAYEKNSQHTYTLALPYLPAAEKGSVTILFSAGDSATTVVTPSFNGIDLTKMSIYKNSDSYTSAMLKTTTTTVKNIAATNTLTIQTTSGRHARLGYIELSYTALLQLDANHPTIRFDYSPGGAARTLSIEYAEGQQPALWRLGTRGCPATALQGTTVEETDDQGVRRYYYRCTISGDAATYVALDAKATYAAPSYVGSVANQNLHALDSLDMVIITPASGIFDTQAQRLAQAHREWDGLRVGVVRADQVFNEFSSGTPDATAYRRFLKMLYDRGTDTHTAPRYLLLFGDGLWDNRMATPTCSGYNADDFLLTYESENSTSDIQCYVMEGYFGLLDDGEGAKVTREKVDLGVGRFPVRTVQEAENLVTKTVRYMNNTEAGAWKNVVCFLGDDGDANEHLRYADDVANRMISSHKEVEVRKIMWDAYTRESNASGYRYPQVTQLITQQMQEGALIMNYTGHAATYCLSHEQVLRTEDFRDFSSPRPPLWFTAACDVQPFDTDKENIGETAILNENGAAIAFFGTTRTAYAYNNLLINRAFSESIFGTDELGRHNRLGDAVRQCKVKVITEGGEAGNEQNKIHYVLLGDPALRLGNYDTRVVVDSINGTAVSALPDDYVLHAGGKAVVTGHIQHEDGTPLQAFDGTIQVHFYDSKNKVVCLNNAGASSAFTFETYDKLLYNGRDSVRAGRFSLTCPIPLDIAYSGEQARMVFYAISSDTATEANGACEAFGLGGTEPSLTDTLGPQIAMYLDTEDFVDGATVGATPYFVATLADSSGINNSGNGVGHDLELIIDNRPATTYNLNEAFACDFGDYTRGTVAYSIPTLEAGLHTLTFRAWDVLNNSSTQTLTFAVDPYKAVQVLELSATQSPATTSTTFVLRYDSPATECTFVIEVLDFAGRLLWTHTETGSSDTGIYRIPWNLTAGGGCPLGSGVYLYRARVITGETETVTGGRKIIINRRQ